MLIILLIYNNYGTIIQPGLEAPKFLQLLFVCEMSSWLSLSSNAPGKLVNLVVCWFNLLYIEFRF